MNNLDKNLQKIILLYLHPKYNEDLKPYEIILNYCYNTYPLFFLIEKEHYTRLTNIINTYSAYNYIESYDVKKDCDYVGGRTLIDILYTGSLPPFGHGTYSVYNNKIEEDLKFIVINYPNSVNFYCEIFRFKFGNGAWNYRNNMYPLLIACQNTMLPLEVVELLLKNNSEHYYNNTILHNITKPRQNIIKKLFEKYKKFIY